MILASARPWHYWIGVVLLFVDILMMIGIVVGYYVKVVRPMRIAKQWQGARRRQAA